MHICMLWYHSYSWGPMLVDCQNVAGSWVIDLFDLRHFITLLNIRGDLNS